MLTRAEAARVMQASVPVRVVRNGSLLIPSSTFLFFRQSRIRSLSFRAIFFHEFVCRVEALKTLLAVCQECVRRRDALAVACSYRLADSVAFIGRTIVAISLQSRAQGVYRQMYDCWCKDYAVLFVRRQMSRMAGAKTAQARLESYREEDRIAKAKRVAGDGCYCGKCALL